MKPIIMVVFLFITFKFSAQTNDQKEVEQVIANFFDAFHKQDSVKIKGFVVPEITMQSIGTANDGQAVLTSPEFGQFLKSVVSIPKDKTFEEKILSYHIQVDGPMANAWTPYEFWFDGALSHCGVNSFQLMKVKDEWKLLYIVDTRRKECDFD